MPTSFSPELMRRIIMDHYSNPRNKRTPEESGYLSIHMDSASCIDDLYIYLKMENDKIVDVAFDGIGCAISIASTSIMSEILKGLTKDEAFYIISQYKAMLHGEDFDEEVLDEAIVFINTYRQASRIKCATIGWDGVYELLDSLKEEKHEH
jgi:nitrogen fixation NifU-like protein